MMMMTIGGLFRLAFASFAFHQCQATSSKITLFAWPGGTSHGFIAAAIAEELAAAGHDVALIAWEEDRGALIERAGKLVKLVTYASLRMPDAAKLYGMTEPDNWTTADWLTLVAKFGALNHPVDCVKAFQTVAPESCYYLLQDTAVKERLAETQFFVSESTYPCATFAPILYNRPFVKYHILGITSGRAEVVDLGPFPSRHSPTLGTHLTDRMTLWESVRNFINSNWLLGVKNAELHFPYCRYLYTPFNVSLGYDTQTPNGCLATHMASLRRSGIDIVFTDPAFEFPRAVNTNVFFVGHPLSRPAEPLTEEGADGGAVKRFMEGATTHGVVVVSLGTLVSLDAVRLRAMADALTGLAPVRVLWKVAEEDDDDGDEKVAGAPPPVGPNVLRVSWMPQNDVLGHPNTRAFLTHGGRNSLEEAAYHGVPLVGIPFLCDQHDNLARPVRHGFGIVLDQYAFDAASLLADLRRALSPEFRAAARNVSARLRARPFRSLDRVRELVEYGIATGGAPFLVPAAAGGASGCDGGRGVLGLAACALNDAGPALLLLLATTLTAAALSLLLLGQVATRRRVRSPRD